MVLRNQQSEVQISKKHPKKIGSQQQIIKRSQISQLYPISRATSYRWEKEGRLKPPTEFGPRCKGWSRKYLDKVFGLVD